ncbi:ferritin subunit [Monomorium pharaonis]|uniref:ferritin subunit n=1 Tax=Monomorium pharaonis TaxID=307658 RepID=UPI00063FC88E|nr:ferritin subunit [Monomorium pharaonis]
MTRLFYILFIILVCIGGIFGNKSKCMIQPAENVPKSWKDMTSPCIKLMKSQVTTEMKAAMTYLAMGAHFARDTINRPGFSKFFFESASEEREHAIKIIEYLLMRGQLTKELSKLLTYPLTNKTNPIRQEWESGEEALIEALELEAHVTRSIREIIITCETPKTSSFNDYHLVDYLTSDFLDEQYKGQRDLAGKISTLGKMMKTHGPLGEFLFDKKLLHGEV